MEPNVVFEIARCQPRHLRRVLQIERASFPGEPYTRDIFRELWCECGEFFFVVKVRRRIAGYIATRLREGNAEVISIAVDPAYRGAGAGAAMLEHTLERLAAAGARSVELMVREDNEAAIRFYRRFGFRRIGRCAAYYGDGEAGVRMRRTLDGPPKR
ncbi:MAG TPA: ribosomal protein S18-alanine N-acetyltransferase [Bryobacteraceae bacterium]|nr:ribosomal protein S18-alanine N-acetyltransferase [Bryobacteraceae bacterium]HOQ47164.1 ribosomal protein S18-alanine N-acetyltransferase [Bryobacteraceae bacterium]HPQ14901.1 ribosomal protein S18-alanine N-acetyltransferase [Bryobacteraceae bacterium]HPU72531.1 ribosomal protein S18-alanine N-acetyltransferase [Bryobacteraceae bacterium]